MAGLAELRGGTIMDFLSSGLFWLFFALIGIFSFIYQFGRGGRGTLSPLIMKIGGLALIMITILSFVFMWWQGGVAILASWIIWAIILGIVFGLLSRKSRGN
jgi:lipopolysaccharide export LptBFGC system permease protein LptF